MNIKKISFILITIFSLAFARVYADTSRVVKVHFLYGSKPARGFKSVEGKRFGGLPGGHVNIEIGDQFLDFAPSGRCHFFPRRKKHGGGFSLNSGKWWARGEKGATVHIPVSRTEYRQLDSLARHYAHNNPYDYAVLGMRCAAATYDVLGEAGLVKRMPRWKNVIRHFYPKLMRKRLFRLAEKKNWEVSRQEGRPSRKWERD